MASGGNRSANFARFGTFDKRETIRVLPVIWRFVQCAQNGTSDIVKITKTGGAHQCSCLYYNKSLQKNQVIFSKIVLTVQKCFYIIRIVKSQ